MQRSLMAFIIPYDVSGYSQTDSLVQTHSLSCAFLIWFSLYAENLFCNGITFQSLSNY